MGVCTSNNKKKNPKQLDLFPEQLQTETSKIRIRQQSSQQYQLLHPKPQNQRISSTQNLKDRKETEKNAIKRSRNRETLEDKQVSNSQNRHIRNNQKHRSHIQKQQFENIEYFKREQLDLKNEFEQYLQNEQFLKLYVNDNLKSFEDQAFLCSINENQFLFKKGDSINYYFILGYIKYTILIVQGLCEKQHPEYIQNIQIGEGIDPIEVRFQNQRDYSLLGKSKCLFWGLKKEIVLQLIFDNSKKNQLQNLAFLESIEILNFSFDRNILKTLIQSFQIFNFPNQTPILQKSKVLEYLVVIKQGSAIQKFESKEILFKKGEIIKYETFLKNLPNEQIILSSEDNTECLIISKKELEQNIGKNQIEKHQKLKQFFETNKQLIQEFQIVTAEKGAVVLNKNKPLTHFILILEGSMKFDCVEKHIYKQGSILGIEFLLPFLEHPIVFENLLMNENGTFGCLNIECLQSYLIPNQIKLELHQQSNPDDFHRCMKQYIILSTIVLEKKSYYITFRTITHHPQELFEIMIANKQQIKQIGVQNQVTQFQKMNVSINFPFLLKLNSAWADQNNIYFFTQLKNGIPMNEALTEIGFVNEDLSRFYISQLILNIEYLHNLRIIHRDINPSNMWISDNVPLFQQIFDQGYLYLRLTPYLKQMNSEKTNTLCGLPFYQAPEVINGEGYTFYADLWSIGICFYEFIAGCYPFGDNLQNPQEIYNSIQNNKIKFPIYVKDKNTRKIIKRFLSKNQSHRLGGSYHHLKSQPFFKGINWENLIENQELSFFIPKIQKIDFKQISKNNTVFDYISNGDNNMKEAMLEPWEGEF